VNKPVSVTGVNVTGTDSGNYTVAATGSTTATIDVRPQSVFTGAAGGAWSNPANWDVMPDGANVASVLIRAAGAAQVVFDGAAPAARLQSLVNGGNLLLAANGLDAARISNTGTLTIGAGASLDLSAKTLEGSGSLTNLGALRLANNNIAGPLLNAGSLTLSGTNRLASLSNSAQVSLADGTTTITGRYVQSAGTTRLGADGVPSPTLAADVVIDAGTLQGSARIAGSLTVNGGTLAPGSSPGAIGIGGDLTLGSAATVALELGGTRPGSFDSLAVQGAARLAGNVVVSSVDGFVPTLTDTFAVLSSGSLTGTFAGLSSAGAAMTGFAAFQLKAEVGGVLQPLPVAGAGADPATTAALRAGLLNTQTSMQSSSAQSSSAASDGSASSGLSASSASSAAGSAAGSSGTGSGTGTNSNGSTGASGSASAGSATGTSSGSSSGTPSSTGATSSTSTSGSTDLPVVRRSAVSSLELPDAPPAGSDKSSSREVRHLKDDKKDKTDQKEPAC